MKFGQIMNLDGTYIDPGVRGHGSKVKVTRSKNFRPQFSLMGNVMIKGYRGQGQRSLRSKSKFMWVKVSERLMLLAYGLTTTPSCIFLIFLA